MTESPTARKQLNIMQANTGNKQRFTFVDARGDSYGQGSQLPYLRPYNGSTLGVSAPAAKLLDLDVNKHIGLAEAGDHLYITSFREPRPGSVEAKINTSTNQYRISAKGLLVFFGQVPPEENVVFDVAEAPVKQNGQRFFKLSLNYDN